MSPRLRIVVHGRAPGDWNMAVDEALLCSPAAGWTLRFYGWQRPTISIGYAQPLARAVDLACARRRAVDVVRRLTGGRAVLHADELTYSLTAPAEHGPLAGGVAASYRRIAAGLQVGLRSIGAGAELVRGGSASSPASRGACFSARTRYELSVGGRKLAGSAQRRREGRLLQHGSMLLGAPDATLWEALGDGFEEAMASCVWLDRLIVVRPARRALVSRLAHAIGAELNMPLQRSQLTVAERRAAAAARARYRDRAWTERR